MAASDSGGAGFPIFACLLMDRVLSRADNGDRDAIEILKKFAPRDMPASMVIAERDRVASEMALHVLAYNLTRVMNIMGIGPLRAAIRA
jgi:hypothetical protein